MKINIWAIALGVLIGLGFASIITRPTIGKFIFMFIVSVLLAILSLWIINFLKKSWSKK